jgi:hypothetical protein
MQTLNHELLRKKPGLGVEGGMPFRRVGFLGLCTLGSLSWGSAACSGSTFTGKDPPKESENGVTDRGAGGDHGSTTNGPGNASGGNAAGGDAVSSGGAATDTAGSGGSATPPDAGMAGEPNPPELPPELGCDAPIHDTWDAPLGTGHSGWRVEFGDPRVDQASQRLIVSYDDVAARNAPLVGGYYLTAEITFEGYTVLTPYPYVWEVLLPSLRRNAAGTGLQLGSTKYGQGNVWHSDLPVGFAGKTLTDTNKALVTTYIKASSKALAVKVQSGDQIYRSGWVSGFTWPETNLGLFRYVGENNSSVYSGASDVVYVGPVDGCQGLSDAAVAQHYDD